MSYLSSDADLCIFFESDGRFPSVFVVEDDGDASFGDTSLTAFVNQILQILSSDGAHIGDSKNETYRIEDIRFAWSVQSLFSSALHLAMKASYSNGIECRIPFVDRGPHSITLETVDNQLFYLHLGSLARAALRRNGLGCLLADSRAVDVYARLGQLRSEQTYLIGWIFWGFT